MTHAEATAGAAGDFVSGCPGELVELSGGPDFVTRGGSRTRRAVTVFRCRSCGLDLSIAWAGADPELLNVYARPSVLRSLPRDLAAALDARRRP